jgi:DNA repair protein SbcD/Mre11
MIVSDTVPVTSITSQLRVLHTADLHLDRQFANWGDAGEIRRRDLLKTMTAIGDIARKQQVRLLLIAGDLFDRHNPPPDIVGAARGWLAGLQRDGVRAAIIPGNHDSYWYERSVFRSPGFPPDTVLFTEPDCADPLVIEVAGVRVHLYGVAFDHTRGGDPLPGFRRRAGDGVHIGLLHGTVDPSPDFAVADRYLPLASAGLRDTGLDYFALGHIHRARRFNAGVPGLAVYPGSPEPLAIDETGQRTVAVLSFRDGPPEVELVPTGMRQARRETVDCTSLDHRGIVDAIVRHADDRAILEAVLTGAPQEIPVVEAIGAELRGRFCHLVVTDRTSVVDTGFVRNIEGERTIRGRFVQRLRQMTRDAATDEDRARAEMALRIGLTALERRSGR